MKPKSETIKQMRNEQNGKLEEMTMSEIVEVLTQFRIILVDGEKIGGDKNSRNYGYCDFDNQTIFVDIDRPQYTVIRTLIHELSHAYHYMKCLHDSENNTERVERNTWKTYKSDRSLK